MRRWLPSLTILLAVLIGGYGVFRQAHLAWGHQPDAPTMASAEAARHISQAVEAHADCPICQLIQGASSWLMPSPPPVCGLVPSPVVGLPASPVAAIKAGIVIRWSLARGPPSIG